MPLHFTAFHPDYKMTDIAADAGRDADARARASRSRNGLHYVYTGNVHDPEGGTTFCPGCAAPLIERDWYAIAALLASMRTAPARTAARRSPAASRRDSSAASGGGAYRCGYRQPDWPEPCCKLRQPGTRR